MNRFSLTKTTWKSTLSITLLGISLFFASLPAFAQGKEQVTIKNKTFSYEISKESTAADLKAIEKEINAEKVANLRFSNIKRNSNNEIIQITTQFNDEKGSSQKKSEYNSQGINPFSVIIHEKENGAKYLEIHSDLYQYATNIEEELPFMRDFLQQNFDTPVGDSLEFAQDPLQDLIQSLQTDIKQQQELLQKLMQESRK
ncbi:hypothetical protein ACPDHL_14875 [Myroides sp. C15-4]|uniref:hypothetical protein n=1 Tax=Myroides sp. C15-4 TaxID=3400532 RepID=UPI003D2F94B9